MKCSYLVVAVCFGIVVLGANASEPDMAEVKANVARLERRIERMQEKLDEMEQIVCKLAASQNAYVAVLVGQLRGDDQKLREQAIGELGRIGAAGIDALPVLLE